MENIKQKNFYIGYDYEFVSNATTNYVVLEKDGSIRPARAFHHRLSNSGLTEYLKHLEIGYFPIIRYNRMSFKELSNFDYSHLAVTNKNYHVLKESNYVITNKDYEILNKEELNTIYKAIGKSYKYYIRVKHQYLEKGYKYVPRFMASLFFNYFKSLTNKLDDVVSNYLVHEDQVENNLEKLNYRVPFSVSYYDVYVLLDYFKETNINDLIRLFNLIDRKVLVDDNKILYVQLKNLFRLVEGKEGKFYNLVLDDNITDVYVTLSDDAEPSKRHLCFYKDGSYSYQEDIIYYHNPSGIDANDDIFVEEE